VNNVYSFFVEPNENFMSSLNIHNIIPYQFLEFSDKFLVLLSLMIMVQVEV
jgi:hypothetical protein